MCGRGLNCPASLNMDCMTTVEPGMSRLARVTHLVEVEVVEIGGVGVDGAVIAYRAVQHRVRHR